MDLWDWHDRGRWAVIPTNLQCRRDGTAVMGAGLAKQAADRFPGLDRAYGEALRNGHGRFVLRRWRLLMVPTKRHWQGRSDLCLVIEGVDGLCGWLDRDPGVEVVVPALGCGLGGLDWTAVEPELLSRFGRFGDRVVLLGPG